MIDEVKYYLGGSIAYPTGSYSGPESYPSGEGYYQTERGNDVQSGRDLYWFGKVALVYVSDYVFTFAYGVDDIYYNTPRNCKKDAGAYPNNNWMVRWIFTRYNQWSLTPDYSFSYRVLFLNKVGAISGTNANNDYGIIPNLYLNPKVRIVSGDGSKENAYKLSL